MPMRAYSLFLLCLLFLTFSSCNQSESQIKSIDAELTLAEQDSSSIDKSDLESLEVQLSELQSDLEANRSSYTDEQIKEIGKLQGRYVALSLKAGLKNLNETIKDAGNQLEGFMEGIQK